MSNAAIEAVVARFGDIEFAPAPLLAGQGEADRQMCVHIPADRLLEVMRFLLDDARCRFEQLADLTCVDYLNHPAPPADRYGVVYNMVSVSLGHRLFAKCFANDPAPAVPSVVSIWRGADWLEREVFDLFGVRFEGHPDLRRIMLCDDYGAHPLRKDYPLRGRGEREAFEVVGRDGA